MDSLSMEEHLCDDFPFSWQSSPKNARYLHLREVIRTWTARIVPCVAELGSNCHNVNRIKLQARMTRMIISPPDVGLVFVILTDNIPIYVTQNETQISQFTTNSLSQSTTSTEI